MKNFIFKIDVSCLYVIVGNGSGGFCFIRIVIRNYSEYVI